MLMIPAFTSVSAWCSWAHLSIISLLVALWSTPLPHSCISVLLSLQIFSLFICISTVLFLLSKGLFKTLLTTTVNIEKIYLDLLLRSQFYEKCYKCSRQKFFIRLPLKLLSFSSQSWNNIVFTNLSPSLCICMHFREASIQHVLSIMCHSCRFLWPFVLVASQCYGDTICFPQF